MFAIDQQLAIWDEALASIRSYFRQSGGREVSTPCRVNAPAIEPFIEPIAASGQWLITSPELAMKQLLARGVGDIFQVAHVFRSGEHGPRHREEFHLIEWYRVAASLDILMRDIEAVVERLNVALGEVVGRPLEPPTTWLRCGLLDLYSATGGQRLRGDESARELLPELQHWRRQVALDELPIEPVLPEDVAQLRAWTELFSLWSDAALDPWLNRLPRTQGLHLVDFPAPLAALAQTKGPTASRFETYWCGAELGNAYLELADGFEQRRRFVRVNALRQALGHATLPLDEAFLTALQQHGLPPSTCGAAMGLERLLCTALSCSLADVVWKW